MNAAKAVAPKPEKTAKKMGRPRNPVPQEDVLFLRISAELRAELEAAMKEEGGGNLNEWCRLALKRQAKRVLRKAPVPA